MGVRWLRRARDDVQRIGRFIATDNPVAAARVARALLAAGDSLVSFPERGRTGRLPGTRELDVIGPYLLVYRVDAAGSVTIVRIWHSAQDR